MKVTFAHNAPPGGAPARGDIIDGLSLPLASPISTEGGFAIFPQEAATTKANIRKKRKQWTKEEDEALLAYMEKLGCDPISFKWNQIAKAINIGRDGKQCRDRWTNNLRPGVKKGDWTQEEEELLEEMYDAFGPKWSAIAKLFTGRTDGDIKNKWYSNSRKRQRMEEKLGHEMLNVATGGLSAAAETTATADDDSDKKNAGRSLGDLAEAAFATEQV